MPLEKYKFSAYTIEPPVIKLRDLQRPGMPLKAAGYSSMFAASGRALLREPEIEKMLAAKIPTQEE